MSQASEQVFSKLGVAQEMIEQARQRQVAEGGYLRQHLIDLNVFTEESFAQKVFEQLRVPYVNLEEKAIADELLALLPQEQAEKYIALPLELDVRHRRLTITMADPSDMSAIDELKFVVGYTVIPHYTPEDELAGAIHREYSRLREKQAIVAARTAYPSTPDIQTYVIDIASLISPESPVSELIGTIITVAHSRQASELHIETGFDSLQVRLRVDEKILDIAQFPKKLAPPLFTRMKRVLGIELGGRSPFFKKGYATVKLKNKKEFDISYQIYPTSHGENISLKLKDRYRLPSLEDLDLEPPSKRVLQKALKHPHGIILATGKARSGLTTTLYALLTAINTPHGNVLSIENPIECMIEGITQGQISEEVGHTYEYYLQNALRHHPDVLMIDKICDARIAQKVLLLSSGALVLSSLFAVDPASAAMKLVLMSDPRSVVDHVNCITSQRLVRKICESCKEEVALSEVHRDKLGLSTDDHCYAGKGCEHCKYTGYKGVISIFEIMPFTGDIKDAIMESCTVDELRDVSARHNLLSLRDDGMRKVKQGLTTVQEVLKATML